jgi:hypothetical protein
LTDTAAALWNATDLLLAMVDDPPLACHLLDVVVRTHLGFHRRVAAAAENVFGRPYSSDLLNEFISPRTFLDVLYPRYETVASAVGGLNFAYAGPDRNAFRAFWRRYDGAVEGRAHRDIPLGDVEEAFAGKVCYALADYPHKKHYQAPTLDDGIYWNPITWEPTDSAPQAHAALAGRLNTHFTISRRTLAEAIARRKTIQAASHTG